MKIAIVGSRGFRDLAMVWEYVMALPVDTVIVSGGARGVDFTAADTANRRGLKTIIFPAEWDKFGRKAGLLRNKKIIDEADRVVAFWDGESTGTLHSMTLAREAGKPLEVIR